ncbi:MAG TPA: orotidine-5'-phosphate decarboxylase [Clostridiales bacterium]|nr:orotidine-5'-phosphate decarboxylase [Clostridiales bacterium]
MSFDVLIEKIVALQNPTVVGLDPKLDFIPSEIKDKAFSEFGYTLEGAAEAIYRFNTGIIDALYDIVPAVKPQCAYYEMYGWPGMRALARTIEYARSKGMFVIADGKRNDIGSTVEAYSNAYLGKVDIGPEQIEPFGADALTVNGYLGSDGIEPLIEACQKYDKGIFVLVKTSNPSSGQLQDLKIDGKAIYAIMGELCEQWGEKLPGKYGYTGVGAVVGATYPQQLKNLRAKLLHTLFLVPGYGAQGAGASDVAGAFDQKGLGAIINSSRAIMCAYKKDQSDDFAMSARREAIRMRDELMSYIGEIRL